MEWFLIICALQYTETVPCHTPFKARDQAACHFMGREIVKAARVPVTATGPGGRSTFLHYTATAQYRCIGMRTK